MASEYGMAPQDRDLGAFITHNATVTGLVRGAVAVGIPGGTNWRDVALPGGAAATAVRGVVYDEFPSGPAVGKPVQIRVAGPGQANLAPGETIDYDDLLIVADASGNVKKRTAETGCDVVARSLAKATAGADPLPIQVIVAIQRIP